MPDLGKLIKMQFCNTCYFTKRLSHAFKIPSSTSLKQGKWAQHRVAPRLSVPLCAQAATCKVPPVAVSAARKEGMRQSAPSSDPWGQWLGCGLQEKRCLQDVKVHSQQEMKGSGIEGHFLRCRQD